MRLMKKSTYGFRLTWCMIVPYCLTLFFLLKSANPTAAQEKRLKLYHAWVTRFEPNPKASGILYSSGDSTITLTSSFDPRTLGTDFSNHQQFYVNEIRYIKLRRKGKIRSGLLIGAICGAAVGAVLGFKYHGILADVTDPASKYVLEGTVIGGGIGGTIGTLIGLGKLKIPINGSQGWFDANYGTLWNRSYVGQNQSGNENR